MVGLKVFFGGQCFGQNPLGFFGGQIVGGEVVYKGLKVWRCLEPVGWDFEYPSSLCITLKRR